MNTYKLINQMISFMRGSRMGRVLIASFSLLCVCYPANAFEAWEHETMSQLSLLVASNYASLTLGRLADANSRLRTMREIVSSFYEGLPESAEWRKPNTPRVTFGEITKLVDYMKDPYDMLHLPQSRVSLPIDARTCNLPYLRSLLDQAGKVISLASASHEAFNHFQGRALDAFCTNHKLAIAAATETNLFGALLLSAYANHFLHDTFAPGHLLTTRDANTHDLDAALLHDDYNAHGLMYVLGAPQQLTDLAGAARVFIDTTSKQWPSQDGKPKHTLWLTNAALDILCERLAAPGPLGIFFLGDGQMTASRLQAALMSIYCSREILDVLESYVRGSPVNSFPDYLWDRRSYGPFHTVEALEMQLPYGELTCSNSPNPISEQKLIRETEKLLAQEPSATNYNVIASLKDPLYRNPAISLTAGFESVSDFDGSHLRGLLEAEMLLGGSRLDISGDVQQLKERDFLHSLWPRVWGVTAGYSGRIGEDDVAQGGFGRVIWPIPPLNLQISGQVGVRYIWGLGVGGFRDFEMLRVDWGLHVLSIFVGVGHDYWSRPDHHLTGGISFESGISLGLPYSKFKNLGSMSE